MDLRTISDIKALSYTSFASYCRGVGQHQTIYNRSDVAGILQFLRLPEAEYPLPEFVFHFLLAFFKEAFETATWRMFPIEVANICTDTGLWIFDWQIEHHWYILLNEEQQLLLSDALTALDAGVELDSIREYNISTLEADSENMTRYNILLGNLGLIPSGSIPPLEQISDSLTIDESTARFSSAMWFEEIQKKNLVIAGLGGIGSYVAFLVSRMHPNALYLYDDDKVETVNMAGQLYKVQDIGQYKVDAIANMIKDYASYRSVFALRERFTQEKEAADIMICGFDNMEARKVFFSKWVAHVMVKSDEERKHCLFLDGRLAAEELQVLCIRGDDSYNITRYRDKFLFSDEEADETLCSYKQTTYMANMIGSIMVNLFTNFVANELVEDLRDLPFFTSYAADSMMFKTEQ